MSILPSNGTGAAQPHPTSAKPGQPAGWYPDPAGAPHLRWFDGVEWTQRMAPWPATPAPATNVGPSSALHWLLPVGRSWQSVLAPYLSLLGLVIPLMGLVGIGFGVWALVKARSGGLGAGRGVFAILFGILGTVISFYLFGP